MQIRFRFSPFLRVFVGFAAAWCGAPFAWTAEPLAPAQWALSADGAYVIDLQAQLAWPRCVEGMQWSGTTCTGKPLLLDRAEASALAAVRWKDDGVAWRLPRAAELQRLAKTSPSALGINTAWFPGAPDLWYWSSTSNVSGLRSNPYNYNTIRRGREGEGAAQMAMLNGWALSLSSGEARGDAARTSKLPVRLVRPYLPPPE